MSYELLDMGTYLHIRFFGVVESKDFTSLFKDFRKYEDLCQVIPCRISTLSDISDFIIQFSTMLPIAQDRGITKLSVPVKSAIVASRPIEKAMASMIKSLNMNPDISIAIFSTLPEAETWIIEANATNHIS